MGTTLDIDDDLAEQLRLLCERDGISFEAALNEVLRRGLDAIDGRTRTSEPLQTSVHASGGLLPPYNTLEEATDHMEPADGFDELARRRDAH